MAVYSSRKENIHIAIDDDEFHCSLCCGLFKEPKLLPNCAHNFCKTCIHELVVRSVTEVSCPVCRVRSTIPVNGAEGFPTNTLLVRLIGNIPIRKEKGELEKMVVLCEEEIERKHKVYVELEEKCKVLERNRELAEELKDQISSYAKEQIRVIEEYKEDLCREVDEFAMQDCGLHSYETLQAEREELEAQLQCAEDAVFDVKRTLTEGDKKKILDMKEFHLEVLNEHLDILCTIGTTVLEDLENVKKFDLEFSKSNINMENGLGRVISKQLSSIEDRTVSAEKVEEIVTVHSGYIRVEPVAVKSSTNTSKNADTIHEGTVIKHIPLQFQPFSVAVSPDSKNIALLYRERRQVHIFSGNGSHISTIYIKYGDLWDVAFSSDDDDVIVVNRTHNRLLFYTQDGLFFNREVEIPRTCLKFTYLSVDGTGRLIITSARVSNDDDDDDDIVQCVIVYQHDNSTHDRMFGRRHLQNPVSRAVFFDGKYCVADRCSNQIMIKTFTIQGEFVRKISLVPKACITSNLSFSRDPFSDRFIMCCSNNSSSEFIKIVDQFATTGTTVTKKLSCPHGFPNQVAAQSKKFFGARSDSTFLVEIYDDQKCFKIVKYPVN